MKRQKKKTNQSSQRTENITEPVSKHIFAQANRMLLAKFGSSAVIDHNLEKGLGNEQALRELMADFLPRRYGVAKGKVVNSKGRMTKHLDIIIYDALHCPTLFIDENRNQILPIEGVYAAIEVKTTLTSTTLSDAFKNLCSIYTLAPRVDNSKNDFITRCLPYLSVFAFNSNRQLEQVGKQFIKLSRKYPVEKSCYSYTPKSPGYAEHTGHHHLVCYVDVLNMGCVRHMLDGTVTMSTYGEYTLGMFLKRLIVEFQDVPIPDLNMHNYMSWFQVGLWQDPTKMPVKYTLIEEG